MKIWQKAVTDNTLAKEGGKDGHGLHKSVILSFVKEA
jgi:hypothetical protein